jgi:ribonucleoside-triphosphate reductase
MEAINNLVVVKRSGQRVSFNKTKIAIAIQKAFESEYSSDYELDVTKIYDLVLDFISKQYIGRKTINVEDIQDIIEKVLEKHNNEIYKSFNDYRNKRAISRSAFQEKQQHKFVKAIEKVGQTVESSKSDVPDDLLLSFGKTVSEEYAKAYLIENKYMKAHEDGKIFINGLEYFPLGITESSNLNLKSIKNANLYLYTDELIKTIINVTKEQYREFNICNLEKLYEPVVLDNFKNIFKETLMFNLKTMDLYEYLDIFELNQLIDNITTIKLDLDLFQEVAKTKTVTNLIYQTYNRSYNLIEESLDLVLKKLLDSLEDTKKHITISLSYDNETTKIIYETYFKVLNHKIITNIKIKDNKIKYGKNINYQFNQDEILSNGLIIKDNIINKEKISLGRIVLSTTTINLARLGFKYNKDNFYKKLEDILLLTKNQLVQRYEYQAGKYKENYKTLFDNNLIYESSKLEKEQKVRKVIKNGVLNISLAGLFECVMILNNSKEFGKDDIELAIEILTFINKKVDIFTKEEKLNFILSEEDKDRVLSKLLTIDKILFSKKLQKNKYELITEVIEGLKLKQNDKIKLELEFQKLINNKIVIKTKNPEKIVKELVNANYFHLEVI